MTYQHTVISDDQTSLPKLPGWVTSLRAETLETVAFRSGAALTVLDGLVSEPGYAVPVKLLANRLALKAATATSKLEGRMARAPDILDAYHLSPPGEARGPDGDMLAFWREAGRLRLHCKDGCTRLKGLLRPDLEDDVTGWLRLGADRAGTHGPLAGCVCVMRAALKADDRAERLACLLSDAILARALNWRTILPVSAHGLTKAMLRDLVADADGGELKIQMRLLDGIEDAIRLSRELAKRARALRAVAPKLRAKGAEAAVALFLSEDAVSPSSMLSPVIQGTTIPMTDRAARRLCDRLVALGVARELTGRSTFRLYGIAP